VGMILTTREVLALIARGDARVAAYEIRIEELEQEVSRLRKEALRAGEARPRGNADWVTLAEAAERVGSYENAVGKWAREGVISGEKRLVRGSDGRPSWMWYVDADELAVYLAMDYEERRAVRRGRVELASVIGANAGDD